MAQEKDQDGALTGSEQPAVAKPEVPAGAAEPTQPAITPEAPTPSPQPEPLPPGPEPLPEAKQPAVIPDEQTMVQQVLGKLLDFMGIRARIDIEKPADGSYYCNIRTRHSSGLLIGHRGGTLRALQYLTRTIVRQHYPDVPVVTVDVGGYRVRRENFLCKKATAVARIVLETKREMALDILTEKEMETVVDALKTIPGVRVYALGTGPRRNVIIGLTAE
jgi:spoIIIJ-associated protein